MIRFSKTYLQYFCSPYRGQKPSLPLRKVFFYLSVSPARRAPHPNQAFPSRKGKDVTALWCSEPLRYKVGGLKRSAPGFAGWDRRGTTCYNLLVETTIFVPHCSIALHLSPLEWGYFLTFCLLQARNKIICCMFCYNIDRKPTLS